MLDHQPPEEHTEKPAVEGGEQEGGLGGAQPEKKLEIRQVQPDHVIDDVLIFRQVRINDAPDFHEVPLQIGGEAGKELPAAGGLQGLQVRTVQPLHRAGGDVVDQAQDLGGGNQEIESGGEELPGLDVGSGHGALVFLIMMKWQRDPWCRIPSYNNNHIFPKCQGLVQARGRSCRQKAARSRHWFRTEAARAGQSRVVNCRSERSQRPPTMTCRTSAARAA